MDTLIYKRVIKVIFSNRLFLTHEIFQKKTQDPFSNLAVLFQKSVAPRGKGGGTLGIFSQSGKPWGFSSMILVLSLNSFR